MPIPSVFLLLLYWLRYKKNTGYCYCGNTTDQDRFVSSVSSLYPLLISTQTTPSPSTHSAPSIATLGFEFALRLREEYQLVVEFWPKQVSMEDVQTDDTTVSGRPHQTIPIYVERRSLLRQPLCVSNLTNRQADSRPLWCPHDNWHRSDIKAFGLCSDSPLDGEWKQIELFKACFALPCRRVRSFHGSFKS